MQKIINGIALLSGVVSIAVVGSVGYLYLNKDAIIEDIKGKVMESVMPDIGSGITDAIPSFTGPATSVPKSPMPEGVGLGVPSF
jgi:hypothetical protein